MQKISNNVQYRQSFGAVPLQTAKFIRNLPQEAKLALKTDTVEIYKLGSEDMPFLKMFYNALKSALKLPVDNRSVSYSSSDKFALKAAIKRASQDESTVLLAVENGSKITGYAEMMESGVGQVLSSLFDFSGKETARKPLVSELLRICHNKSIDGQTLRISTMGLEQGEEKVLSSLGFERINNAMVVPARTATRTITKLKHSVNAMGGNTVQHKTEKHVDLRDVLGLVD